ncbi:MAG: helix-turn-helix transcriptional regulator [Fusobacteria bacterium]|nr:helix-turn-helix transcriptional regulator [Fusobacteriota bacterium]
MKKFTIGELLKIEMKRAGITQIELAEKLEIDKRTVSLNLKKFENNQGRIENLFEYLKVLDFDIEINIKNNVLERKFDEIIKLAEKFLKENYIRISNNEIPVKNLDLVSDEIKKIFEEKGYKIRKCKTCDFIV